MQLHIPLPFDTHSINISSQTTCTRNTPPQRSPGYHITAPYGEGCAQLGIARCFQGTHALAGLASTSALSSRNTALQHSPAAAQSVWPRSARALLPVILRCRGRRPVPVPASFPSSFRLAQRPARVFQTQWAAPPLLPGRFPTTRGAADHVLAACVQSAGWRSTHDERGGMSRRSHLCDHST